jgi:hypothetical protein
VTELRKYGAEWIKQQVGDRDWLPLRRCSLCNQTIGYIIEHGQLYFVSACGCSSAGSPQPRTFDAIEETLAMQSSDEIRDRMMATMLGEREPA